MKNIINKYLNNELEEKESEAFTKLLIRSLERNQHRKRYEEVLLDDWDVNRDKSSETSRPIWKKRWLWSVLSVAAIGLLLLAILPQVWSSSPTPAQYAEDYLTNPNNYFDNAGIRKNANAADPLNEFDLAYYAEDYAKVQQIGEELISQNKAETSAQFFTGLSYLYDEKAERAVQLFRGIVRDTNSGDHWREEANWFLAIALTQNQQEKEAQEVLLSIQAGEWNYQRAQELLGCFS